jgi:hypothetical protein
MVTTNFLEELLDYIIAQGVGVATKGTDGFYSTMPDDPDNLLAILEYQGTSAFLANFGQRSIQPNVRDANDHNARTKIWDIYNLFHKENMEERIIVLNGSRWAIFSCRQSPFKLKEDESKRSIYVFNMGVTVHDET